MTVAPSGASISSAGDPHDLTVLDEDVLAGSRRSLAVEEETILDEGVLGHLATMAVSGNAGLTIDDKLLSFYDSEE